MCNFWWFQWPLGILGRINLYLLPSNKDIFTFQTQQQGLDIPVQTLLFLLGAVVLCRLLMWRHKYLKVPIVILLYYCEFFFFVFWFLPSLWRLFFKSSLKLMMLFLDGVKLAGSTFANNCCYSSSNESTPRTWKIGEISEQGDQSMRNRGMSSIYCSL